MLDLGLFVFSFDYRVKKVTLSEKKLKMMVKMMTMMMMTVRRRKVKPLWMMRMRTSS